MNPGVLGEMLSLGKGLVTNLTDFPRRAKTFAGETCTQFRLYLNVMHDFALALPATRANERHKA